MRMRRTLHSLLACAACLIVGCDRIPQTDTSNEARMDADTVAHSADSLMIGTSGAAAIPPEVPQPTSGQTQFGALSDQSAPVPVDQPSSATPQTIPPERRSGASSTTRHFP